MRTNIEIDDDLLERAMRMYGVTTKRAAVDLALRRLVSDPLTSEEARQLRGSGWGADLDALRSGASADPL